MFGLEFLTRDAADEATEEFVAVGESRAADWPQSFLGLRFPASDIPAQARQLYRLTDARWLPTRCSNWKTTAGSIDPAR